MSGLNSMGEVKVDVSGEMNVPKQDPNVQFDFKSLLRLQHIPTPLELLQIARQQLRPWSEVLNTSNYKSAASMPRLSSRFLRNLVHFQSNYICVFIFLMIYCIITSPLILLVLSAVAYLSYKIRKTEKSITIYGQQLGTKQLIVAANIAAVPVLFLVGAAAALFWTLGASIFLIALHASFYNIDALSNDDADGFLSEVV